MIKGLRTVIYPAPNLAEAKDWYSKVLGHQPYFDQPFYVGFSVGGFELGLVPDTRPSADGPRAFWGVDDAEATLKTLIELGAAPLEQLQDVGSGIKVASVTDPFGNSFGIIENPNFKIEDVR
jgi:catechol 2,3-dioxygenase-like lactoylglutathione lyase family enzyme